MSDHTSLPVGYTVLIRPYRGSNALELRDGNGDNGTPITAMPIHRERNQQWLIEKGEHGGVRFKNAEGGSYLGIGVGQSYASMAVVVGQKETGLEFKATKGLKATRLKVLGHFEPDLRLDYVDMSPTPPVKIWLIPPNWSEAQEWIIEFVNPT